MGGQVTKGPVGYSEGLPVTLRALISTVTRSDQVSVVSFGFGTENGMSGQDRGQEPMEAMETM